MAGWRETTLGEVCDEVGGIIQTGPFGSQLHEADYSDEGIPVVMPKDIVEGRIATESVARVSPEHVERLSRHKLEEGDIVYGRRGDIGRQALIRQEQRGWLCGTGCLRLSVGHSVLDPFFLHYYFRQESVVRWISNQAVGATLPNLNTGILRSVPVNFPPLPVQRRIASILSAYDELIENSQRRIKILEAMARVLYREWFRPTSTDRVVRADQLVSDGVLEINDGYRAKNSELGSPGLPFARAGNVNNGFQFDDADLLAEQNLAKVGSKLSAVGDVVFTSKGTVGRFARVRERTPTFVYSPQLCFWRVRNPAVLSPNYLYRWLQSREFLEQVDRVKSSTDMADYVSLTNQRRMMVRVPSAAAQLRGNAVFGPLEDLIGALEEKARVLRKTRDLLLPRLLSGQIDVEAA